MKGKWVNSVAFAQHQAYERLLPPLAGKTVLATLKNGLPGEGFRVVLGERYGSKEVCYENVVIQVNNVQVQLQFCGQQRIAIAPGQLVYSDVVSQHVAPGNDIKLWLYIEEGGQSHSATICPATHSREGNFVGEPFVPEALEASTPGFTPEERLCGLCGVQVLAAEDAPLGSIAAFGDSITQMGFWTEPLRQRISQANANTTLLNMGIGGNRLLRDTHIPYIPGVQMFGRAGLTRFAWDVAELPGVKTVMVALGINDISQPGGTPGMSPPAEELCTFEAMCEGYQRLVDYAHRVGVKAVGCTITPFGGYATYNEHTAALRNKVNRWILESCVFDTVVDFAAAVSQKNNPDFLLPQYDTGDHLHPNEAGGMAMAACVDMNMLLAL